MEHTQRTRFLVAFFLTAAVVLAGALRTARAGSPVRWFGTDARNAAMGGGGAALGTGPGNLLVNPSLMSFSPSGVWLTISAAQNWLSIDPMKRDPKYDVPDSIYETRPDGWGQDRPVPTSMLSRERGATKELPGTYLLSLAAIGSFGVPGLRIGAGFTAPVPSVVKYETWYNDEREQHFSNRLHFERFGEFDGVMTITPAASYAPLDWLSLGLAVRVDLTMGMGAALYMPEGSEWEYSYVNSSADVTPAVRPIAGVAFRTPIGLRFGAVYSHYSYTDVKMDVRLRIWNGERPIAGSNEVQKEFLQHHRFVLGYDPRQVALAAAYEIGPFSIEASGAWEQWSQYLDRHGNGYTHPTPGSSDGSEPASGDGWTDPGFEDVWTARGGVEWRVTDFAALRAGAGFFPSPMPEQTGRYNYVDNDLVLYSLGAGFRFQIRRQVFTIDVAGQVWQMLELTVNKEDKPAKDGGIVDEVPSTVTDYNDEPLAGAKGLQTNNPGFPGYGFGGVVFNASLMLGTEFD
ncbi:MAG: outer membrane protein transport protein [Deltaproteobacteria bacterium]|nr:outer membrane protein transport protein [Deltaproteobacteria bacterium]